MSKCISTNKCEYRYRKVIQLQEAIDTAGGHVKISALLNMTLWDLFDRYPQNGIFMDFGFNPILRDKMQGKLQGEK